MISYADALAKKFENSTFPELKEYHRERFGVEAPKTMNGPTIKTKLLRDAGLINEFSAPAPKLAQSREPIFPAYNLSPNGLWGGRRHRIRVAKPGDATKNEKFWEGSVNGGNTYFLKYGEVQNVPEPIYLRLRDATKPRAEQRRIPRDDGGVDLTTEIVVEPRFAIDYKGVDPETAHLCGSLTEWYQLKGPTWFRNRSDRDLQLISERLELPYRDEDNRPLPREHVLDQLVEFFFGYAEATEETVAEAAA